MGLRVVDGSGLLMGLSLLMGLTLLMGLSLWVNAQKAGNNRAYVNYRMIAHKTRPTSAICHVPCPDIRARDVPVLF